MYACRDDLVSREVLGMEPDKETLSRDYAALYPGV